MLTIAKPAPNRIDIEFRGALDAETMRTALDDLVEKSEGDLRPQSPPHSSVFDDGI